MTTYVTDLITSRVAWFERAAFPSVRPFVLAVLHQTATSGTTPAAEKHYADGNVGGASATYYLGRDGTALLAVDGTTRAAWGSGDIKSPRTSIPTVARIAALGANANLAIWEQLEGCGQGAEPWLDAQFEAAAEIIAARSKRSGLAIDRTTVLVHADLNGVDRPADPWPPSTREARVARVIVRANELAGGAMIAPTDQPTEYVDLVPPPGGVAATVYAEDFHTILGTIKATAKVAAYGLVRPRASGAALTAIVGPAGSSFAGKVGWLGVDWVANRRLAAPLPIVVTVHGASQTVTF
jgi:N-acetylmuramoyl-L-alanine amidase